MSILKEVYAKVQQRDPNQIEFLQAVQEVLEPATSTLMNIAPYLETAKWLLLAVTLVGIGAMVWARIDDRRKGLR
jgi:hypothetical protein